MTDVLLRMTRKGAGVWVCVALLALLAAGCGAGTHTNSENGAQSPPKEEGSDEEPGDEGGAVYQSGTWCAPDESVVFSCVFENRTDIASLCGEYSAESGELSRLSFRQGAGEPAIEVVNEPGAAMSTTFGFGHYTRALVSMTRVTVEDESGAVWTVTSDYQGEENPAAEVEYQVQVQSETREESFRCLPGTAQDRLMAIGDAISPERWLDI